MDARTELRLKPKSERLELTLPLDTRSENYHFGVDEALQLNSLTLRSKPAELATPVAMGVFRDGRLLLMPVDLAHCLRPALDHLDVSELQAAQKSEKVEGKPGPSSETDAVELQVQFKKQETERQMQQRLNSFAHRSEAEAREAWLTIDIAAQGVEDNFFGRMSKCSDEQLQSNLSREQYLATLMPGVQEEAEREVASLTAAYRSGAGANSSATIGTARADSAAAGAQSAPTAPESLDRYSGAPLSEDETKALKKSLIQLLRRNPVVKLRGIRWWLANSKSVTPLDRIFTGSDALLHHAAMQMGLLEYVREVYVQVATDSADLTTFRKIILDLMSTRPAVRKQEIISAAKERGLGMSDTQCLKAIKEICQSRAAVWTLQAGFTGNR